MLLCRNNATINAHVKTQHRVKHPVWHTDPWPDSTWPKLLTRWPETRRPGCIPDLTEFIGNHRMRRLWYPVSGLYTSSVSDNSLRDIVSLLCKTTTFPYTLPFKTWLRWISRSILYVFGVRTWITGVATSSFVCLSQQTSNLSWSSIAMFL